MGEYAAVRLFVERAVAAKSDFTLTDQNASILATVCHRLDGIPLAIELAAARVRAMPLEQIESLLDSRFRLLTGGSRTALPRQQTLRALIDWSYDLLKEPEKALLCRLSVFAGGWTLEAAERVCSGPLSPSASPGNSPLLVPSIHPPAERSKGIPGEPNSNPIPIRQSSLNGSRPFPDKFAQARKGRGDSRNSPPSLSGKGAGGLGPAERSEGIQGEGWGEGDLWGDGGEGGIEEWEVLDLLTSLVDKSLVVYEEKAGKSRYRLLETVRQYARDRLMESGKSETVRLRHRDCFLELAELAELELSGPKQGEWLERLETEHENLRAALDWSLQAEAEAEEGLRLCGVLQMFWTIRGHISEGREWCERALRIVGGQDRTQQRAKVLNGAGKLAQMQSDYVTAKIYLEESLGINRKNGDREGVAAALNVLGTVASNQGVYTDAHTLYEECLVIFREMENRMGAAMVLNNLGNVAMDQGDFASARAYYEASLDIKRELGNTRGMATSLCNLGILALEQGDHASARSYYQESLDIRKEIGDRTGIADSLNGLGTVTAAQGDYASARTYNEESLKISQEIGDRLGIAYALHNLAGVTALGKRPERGVVLWGAIEALREEIGSPLSTTEQDRIDRVVAATREALGETAFSTAWAKGRAMTLEQAIFYYQEAIK